MKESYKFKVNCRGGDGIVFEMSPNQTLLHMMSFICDEWLEEYRNGDGVVWDHLWNFCHPDDNEYQPETHHKWTRAQEMAYENYLMARNEGFMDAGLPIDVSLKKFRWWDVGMSVPVNYDTGSPIYFEVSLLSKGLIADGISLPRIPPDEADKLAETFTPFVPEAGTPNLNEIFPHANRIMFEMGSKWLCPYPCSDTSGGFVEGPGGDSDLIFIPEPLESLQHALIGINRAAEECPGSDEGRGYSRSVWDLQLSRKAKKYYNANATDVQEFFEFEQNVDPRSLYGTSGVDFDKLRQYSENIQRRYWYPQAEFYYRLTKEDAENFNATAVEETFPLCAKAYKEGLWASYHRGKVKIAKGSDTGERGVPQTILAQVKWEITSLHEFFCVCEGLFQMEKNNHVFAALQKSVALDPHMINGKKRKLERE